MLHSDRAVYELCLAATFTHTIVIGWPDTLSLAWVLRRWLATQMAVALTLDRIFDLTPEIDERALLG